jgi:phage-related minor tail protein
VIGFFTGTDWAKVGNDIVTGIGNGIGAMAGWLAEAARNVAQGALDAIKGFLGIKSPSAVMAGIGGHMMQGWAQGITMNADLPTQAALGVAGNVTRATTQNFNLNIYGGMAPENPAQDFAMMKALLGV